MGYGQLQQINEIFKQKERIYNRYSANLDNVKVTYSKNENYTTKFIMWVLTFILTKILKLQEMASLKYLKKKYRY